MTLPDKDTAVQFAIILQAGLPASEAIRYFTDSDDPAEIGLMLQKWQRSAAVRRAVVELEGKSWSDMSLEEKIKSALDHHYAGLAYLLRSVHYVEATSGEKGKLDSARLALEAKLAGTAGKTDALTRFFDDINSGRLNLPQMRTPKGVLREIPS